MGLSNTERLADRGSLLLFARLFGEAAVKPEYLEILIALLGGGAGFAFLGKMLELLFSRGKALRDELRAEIARLEGNIKALDAKVVHLENEVETWKTKVDEWRNKFYALLEEHQLLKVAVVAKDQLIAALQAELAHLKGEKEETDVD